MLSQNQGKFGDVDPTTYPNCVQKSAGLAAICWWWCTFTTPQWGVFRAHCWWPGLKFKIGPKRIIGWGAVNKHVYNFVENLVKRESPLVFKIGYTHDPHTRFRNKRYGYSSDSFHKWQSMVILFAGSNSTAAAYIEAAAIQKFKGHLVEHVQRMFWFRGYRNIPLREVIKPTVRGVTAHSFVTKLRIPRLQEHQRWWWIRYGSWVWLWALLCLLRLPILQMPAFTPKPSWLKSFCYTWQSRWTSHGMYHGGHV